MSLAYENIWLFFFGQACRGEALAKTGRPKKKEINVSDRLRLPRRSPEIVEGRRRVCLRLSN